jgi:hypothetical protein
MEGDIELSLAMGFINLAGEHPSYRMRLACSNCREDWLVDIRKGSRVPRKIRCPNCHCHRVGGK